MRKITLPLQRTNVTETNGNLKVKKSQLLQALENGSSWVAIGFGFTSECLKRWQVFFSRPITERRQTQCNTAVQSILDWKFLNWIHKITIKPRTIFHYYRLTLPLKFNVKRYVYHTCWQCQLWADGWQSLDTLMTEELKTQFWTQFPEHCHIPLGYEEQWSHLEVDWKRKLK